MHISDILALIFGGTTIVTTLIVAAMWVGGLKSKSDLRDEKIRELADELQRHVDYVTRRTDERNSSTEELAKSVVELRSELRVLEKAIANQPETIAKAVALAIREVMTVMRAQSPKRANA